jgi:hypothetical protein
LPIEEMDSVNNEEEEEDSKNDKEIEGEMVDKFILTFHKATTTLNSTTYLVLIEV